MQSNSSTSSSNASEGVRRLLLRLALFVLPFVAVLGVPVAAMFMGGEFTSTERVIELQADGRQQTLFGRAYSDPTAHYKLRSVLVRRPEVLVLGTSRVMAIRSNAFRDGVAFFNAGNGVTRLRHYRAFLKHLPPDAQPRLIVLGLDQYFFNERFDPLADDDIEQLWSADTPAQDVFFAAWKTVYRDLIDGKFAFGDFAEQPENTLSVGVNAVVNGNGFRNDGSYTWAQYVADPWNPNNQDYEFRNTLDRIENGYRRFEYGEHVSAAALREVEAFLTDCRDRGIHVVAFLPPFAHQIYETMRKRSVDYGYLRELEPALRPIFERHAYPLLDFSDLEWLGASDRETIDGFHGSEKAYVRLLLRLIAADESLRAVARDASELERLLNGAAGDHLVFPINDR